MSDVIPAAVLASLAFCALIASVAIAGCWWRRRKILQRRRRGSSSTTSSGKSTMSPSNNNNFSTSGGSNSHNNSNGDVSGTMAAAVAASGNHSSQGSVSASLNAHNAGYNRRGSGSGVNNDNNSTSQRERNSDSQAAGAGPSGAGGVTPPPLNSEYGNVSSLMMNQAYGNVGDLELAAASAPGNYSMTGIYSSAIAAPSAGVLSHGSNSGSRDSLATRQTSGKESSSTAVIGGGASGLQPMQPSTTPPLSVSPGLPAIQPSGHAQRKDYAVIIGTSASPSNSGGAGPLAQGNSSRVAASSTTTQSSIGSVSNYGIVVARSTHDDDYDDVSNRLLGGPAVMPSSSTPMGAIGPSSANTSAAALPAAASSSPYLSSSARITPPHSIAPSRQQLAGYESPLLVADAAAEAFSSSGATMQMEPASMTMSPSAGTAQLPQGSPYASASATAAAAARAAGLRSDHHGSHGSTASSSSAGVTTGLRHAGSRRRRKSGATTPRHRSEREN